MKHNRDKLFRMLEYIEKKEKKVEPLELIAYYTPSMYELNLVYNKTYRGQYFNITIDLKDKVLKGAIRKSYQLREDDFSSKEIFRYLKGE